MAKYLAQIVVMGAQVVGRAFARALRQEFAASQAAAQARNSAGQHSAAASSITGMSLQEAQQILHISELTPEAIQKLRSAEERQTGRRAAASVGSLLPRKPRLAYLTPVSDDVTRQGCPLTTRDSLQCPARGAADVF
uniref:Presequence translocase associated motor 16 n=1 Tax=Gasterosteus aculeatus aculeatus TaxID=481459 RepID=A0AAQ4R8D9_GASAC